jgi:hypothetical protein
MSENTPGRPRQYVGENRTLLPFVTRPRRPTLADYRQPETGKYYIYGTVWQVGPDPTTGTFGELWMLSKIVANQGIWVLLGTSTSGGILTINSTVSPDINGNINLLGSTNILITNATNQLTASLQGPIPNALLANSTIGLNAGTGVTVSSSPVALGGSTTIGVSNIPNASLANSSINVVGGSGITVSGSPVSLGGSVTISTSAASTNPAFHVYLTTSQVYPQGNPVPFDATDINVGGFYSTSAFSATAPVKGFYSFVVHIGISSSSPNFSLTLNNTTTGVAYQTQNCSALATRNNLGFLSVSSAFLIPCNANDVLNVTVVNSPNGTLAGIQGLVQFTTFAGVLISSLP